MIHITLSAERRDPQIEPLGRDCVGYREGMTQAEFYHANHGTWVIGRNRRHERYILFTFRGEVKQAVEIHQIERLVIRTPDDTRDDRCVIHGKILEAGHTVFDTYVYKPSSLRAGRNPVRCFDSPLDTGAPCRCGCGEVVVGKDFKAGHDQTTLHGRVRQIGTVADFHDWFDVVRGHKTPTASTIPG